MPSNELRQIWLPPKGGLDTATDSILLAPDQMSVASNSEYEKLGGRLRRGGTVRYNALQATLSGTAATISAMADFWLFATNSQNATQSFVIVASTQSAGAIYKGAADGSLTLLKAPWGAAGRRTSIRIAQGLAIISDGTDVVQAWDQQNIATLSICMPAFETCVYHLRRLWYWGVSESVTSSSSVGYTTAGNIADATGSDAGTFIFDENDGDRVIGVSEPWRERLLIFKGPNKGSVHQIGGTTPTTFTKGVVFRQAAPAVSAAGIVTTANDIYWMSKYGFHSLQATAKYGDTEESYISFPIQNQFNELNIARLNQSVGFYNPTRNTIGWACPAGSGITNTKVFVYHYLLGFWSIWSFTGFDAASFMLGLTPSDQKPRLYIGDYNGYIHAGDQLGFTDTGAATAAYTTIYRTPKIIQLTNKDAATEAIVSGVITFARPTGGTCSLSVIIDGRETQYSVDLSDSTVTYVETPTGGDRGRTIELQWLQNTTNDMRILGYGLRYKPGETNARESS